MHPRSIRPRYLVLAVAVCWSAAVVGPAWAAGQVRLELFGDAQGAAMAFQEWSQVLGKAGIKNVRLRTSEGVEKVGIEVQGTEQSPVYVVTGLVLSREELLLPSGRIKRTEAARLARWLDDLAAHGPPDRRPPKSAFGLTKDQFGQVRQDLAQAVSFSTQGVARTEVAAKIARQMRLPLRIDPAWSQAAAEDKVVEELQGLSCGTALAYVLRPAGFCLVPELSGQQPGYAVVKARPELTIWPVGWEPPPEKQPRDVLPLLYEFLEVNVQNVPASQALEAIGKRLQVPVLLDYNAMARYGIDPQKAMVSFPPARTTYSLALRRLLFQARLKFEVRLDEADKPFLWISTVKPV